MNVLDLRGGPQATGVYLLHIRLAQSGAIRFGRFRGGQPVAVAAGDWLYVGSAMGAGATSLAGRLLRHATRCPPAPPHECRDALCKSLAAAGLASALPAHKRRHWHIDYLLDEPAAELVHVWAARSEVRLEAALAEWLSAQPRCRPAAAGLGATDHPGHTHLRQTAAPLDWADWVARLDDWWVGHSGKTSSV